MIDDILTQYWEDCKPEPCEFGHLYWCATEYPPEELRLWRPSDADLRKSFATDFRITKPPDDAFKRKFPLSNPRLDTKEEFVVTKSKARPVILIIPPRAINIQQQKNKGRIWRPLCLVAPIFSLAFPNNDEEKFPEELVNEVRRLEHPQLVFLPKYKDALKVDSLMRLDECQSVAVNALRPAGVTLTDGVKSLLRSQLIYLIANQYDGDYHVYRECIKKGFA